MKTSKFLRHLSFWAAASCLLFAYPAFASRETVLHNFTDNPDGASPMYNLIFDNSGNLFGTTSNGGSAFESLRCGIHGWYEQYGNSFQIDSKR
jgi:hypothetical protein